MTKQSVFQQFVIVLIVWFGVLFPIFVNFVFFPLLQDNLDGKLKSINNSNNNSLCITQKFQCK